jgi:hypothetical protein
LADDLFGVDGHGFTGERQGLLGFCPWLAVLGATEGGGLFEREVAAIDENAVVD